MDKFSYAIGLGIGQNLFSMGARGIDVNDFAQAIKDVLDGKTTLHKPSRMCSTETLPPLHTPKPATS